MYQLYHMADHSEASQGGTQTSILALLANKITGR